MISYKMFPVTSRWYGGSFEERVLNHNPAQILALVEAHLVFLPTIYHSVRYYRNTNIQSGSCANRRIDCYRVLRRLHHQVSVKSKCI